MLRRYKLARRALFFAAPFAVGVSVGWSMRGQSVPPTAAHPSVVGPEGGVDTDGQEEWRHAPNKVVVCGVFWISCAWLFDEALLLFCFVLFV